MLKLNAVTYRYKKSDRDVVKNVSCEFESRKLTAVVGASGSGKTTLLSILAGLDAPRSGEVFIEQDSLATLDLDKYRRERVSMIFQAFHLFPLMTALENVCYPMKMNGTAHYKTMERAKKYLNDVGISEDKFNRYPSNLSGGEQQRVAIARALSTGAKVLLADEPTGNLDVANGEIVMDVLKKLAHKEGYCVVVVTHNLDIAEASDVVYKMSDGILREY
jgi:putative ABC transport system ATP-binding protein